MKLSLHHSDSAHKEIFPILIARNSVSYILWFCLLKYKTILIDSTRIFMGIVHRVLCIPDYEWGLSEKWASNVQARAPLVCSILNIFTELRSHENHEAAKINIKRSFSIKTDHQISKIVKSVLYGLIFSSDWPGDNARIYVCFLWKLLKYDVIISDAAKLVFLMPSRQLTCAQVNFIPSTYSKHLSSPYYHSAVPQCPTTDHTTTHSPPSPVTHPQVFFYLSHI